MKSTKAIEVLRERVEWLEKKILPRRLAEQPVDFYMREVKALEMAIAVLLERREEKIRQKISEIQTRLNELQNEMSQRDDEKLLVEHRDLVRERNALRAKVGA